MKKILSIIFLCLITCIAKSQVYQIMPQFGYQFKRIKVDSTLHIPSFCGVPTLRNSIEKEGAIAIDTCNNVLYKYTRLAGWTSVSGGAGASQDLASVLNIGNKGYKNIELYTSEGSDNIATISPVDNDGRPLLILIDSINKSIQLTTNSKTENPAILFGDGSIYQSLEHIPNSEGIVFMPIQNSIVSSDDTLATLRDVRSSIIDTANKWVNSVTKLNDSTIRVVKDGTTNDLIITGGINPSTDTAKVVIAKVHNGETTTLTRGTIVYLFGANGNTASVKRANNKSDATSSRTFGIVREDISSNQIGYITTQGQIDKLNLGSYTEGDVLWLDSLDGQFTKVKPVAPYHSVLIGVVERANNGNGIAYAKIQNGQELSEIHDVQISSVANNQIIVYSDTQSVWKNRSIYSVVDTANKIATKTNLNNKLNITDTASMLTPYQRSISAMKYTDTANMLTSYQRSISAMKYSDTASMLNNYARGNGGANRLAFWNGTRSLSSNSNLTINNTNPSIISSTTGYRSEISPLEVINTSTDSSFYASIRTTAGGNEPQLFLYHGDKFLKYTTDSIYLSKNSGNLSIKYPTLSTNRTINIPDNSGTIMLQGDTASLSTRINSKVGGSGTNGSLVKFNGTSSVTDAVADVDYMQQDMSLIAYQSMGSTIKGYTLQCPIISQITTSSAVSTGLVFFIAVYIPKAVTLTGIKWYQASNASGASTGYNGVGLYSASGGTLTLRASSTDDATCWTQGANAWKSKAFSSTYSASAGLYYIAFVMNYNTSGASVGLSTASTNLAVKNADFTNNNKLSGTLTSTTFPSTQALSGTTTNVGNHAFYVY